MKFHLLILSLLAVPAFMSCCTDAGDSGFFSARDGMFIPAEGYSGENAFYYIGTNLWYGAVLGSDTEYGDRERLAEELDSLKSLGVTNIRVLAGGDGPAGIPSQIEPSLQTAAGVYEKVEDAISKMNSGFSKEYKPQPDKVKAYAEIYKNYLKLGAFTEKELFDK